MSLLTGIAQLLTRRPGSRSRTPKARKSQRARRSISDASRRLGMELPDSPGRWRSIVRMIPVWVLGGVAASLVIAYVRVEITQQGYLRADNVTRHQALEEEQRSLAARVRELRNPVRLTALAKEMGLSRPERVIALSPRNPELRP